jgi:hypothetical protein
MIPKVALFMVISIVRFGTVSVVDVTVYDTVRYGTVRYGTVVIGAGPSCEMWYFGYPFVRREMRSCQWGHRGRGKRWNLSFGNKRGTG